MTEQEACKHTNDFLELIVQLQRFDFDAIEEYVQNEKDQELLSEVGYHAVAALRSGMLSSVYRSRQIVRFANFSVKEAERLAQMHKDGIDEVVGCR